MRVPFIPYIQGRNDYTDGDKIKYGLAIHNTSNNASDTGEAAYATRRTDGVSAHFYTDGDSATQSIDTEDKTGHAGSAIGNENAISVEITGANGWSRAQWLANVEWDLLGRVLAAVIRHHWPDGSFQVRRATVAEMKANPKVKAFYGHDDMRRAWGGTTHTDPGPAFPWDKLFAVVNAALEEDGMPYSPAEMRAFPWQYNGRGIGDNDQTPEDNISTLGVLNFIFNTVKLIADRTGSISPEELLAIRTASEAGARAALADSVDEFVDGVLAGLDPNNLSVADVETAVRNVLINGVGAQPEGSTS